MNEAYRAPAVPGSSDRAEFNSIGLLLGLMLFLTPAIGVPGQEMLQDTLKSMIVGSFVLVAAFTSLWQRNDHELRWHGVIVLPAMLAAYAIFSMAWSHAYLAGIEAMRWILFCLLVWLVIQAVAFDKKQSMFWGMHWGLTVASIWTALQFWADFSFFAQGPQPASTFVNRNFFAEYALCALPFSFYIASLARTKTEASVAAALAAFNTVCVLMTGTRSAYIALFVILVLAVALSAPAIIQSKWDAPPRARGKAFCLTFIIAFSVFGLIPSNNSSIDTETGNSGAIVRAAKRIAALQEEQQHQVNSWSMRSELRAASWAMVMAQPLTGVGAGAWEVHVPRYQGPHTQNEIDYYAHNEPLQIIAEYGLIGGVFLVGLIGFLGLSILPSTQLLLSATGRHWSLRLAAICSLCAALIVSLAGFPWRLAGSGMLFAVAIGVLASTSVSWRALSLSPTKLHRSTLRTFLFLSFLLTFTSIFLWVSARGVVAEKNLARSLQATLQLAKSTDKSSSTWIQSLKDAAELADRGIQANPHYRKISAEVGDAFARAGDWQQASKVWESVVASRPYVVSILCNLGRSYFEAGRTEEAKEILARAKQLKPEAPAVAGLDLYMLIQENAFDAAHHKAAMYLEKFPRDLWLIQLTLLAANKAADWELMVHSLGKFAEVLPGQIVSIKLQIAEIYADPSRGNSPELALAAYQSALRATNPRLRADLMRHIPGEFHANLTKEAIPH